MLHVGGIIGRRIQVHFTFIKQVLQGAGSIGVPAFFLQTSHDIVFIQFTRRQIEGSSERLPNGPVQLPVKSMIVVMLKSLFGRSQGIFDELPGSP